MAKIIVNNPRQVINGGAKKYYFKVKGLGGPKGDKGDKGDTGSQGPQGPQGNAATVSVGSTTTLPVGQDATVQNVGTLYNAVLNFGIPQGPRGPQGATGATGAKGDKGDQGNPGPQGEKGTNATVYVGTTSTLNPGSQATVYNSGTDSNAVLNFGIPKGEKGDTGPMPTIAQTTGQAIDQVMSQKATTDALNTKQATITSSNKLSADLVDDTSTTNKFVTASDITNWNAKQDALTAGTGIDITSGIISTPAIVPEVVTELPTTGAEGKLYLTPKAHTTQTATGNPITATVAEEAGTLESFQLDGDTFQQSYTGKNLLDIQDNLRASDSGLNYSFSNNELTVSGTPTRGWANVTSDINVSLPAGQYTLSLSKQLTYRVYLHIVYTDSTSSDSFITNAGQTSTTITLAKDVSTIRLDFSMMDVGVRIDDSFSLQLEAGATATSFEPFVGRQPSPSPDYPQNIQVVTGKQTVKVLGKNRFDVTATPWVDKLAFDASGNQVWWSGYVGIKEYQPVEPETTYTFSNSTGKGITYGLVYYDANKQKISNIVAGTTTFTTPANCRFIRFAVDSATKPTWTQLERGSTATAFAPFEEETIEIDLGDIELCKLGDYQDYVYKSGEKWYVHKEIGKVTLDGSETWTKASANSGYRFWTSKATDIKTSVDAVLKANRLGVAQGDTWDNYGISGSYSTNPIRLYIRDALFNDMTVEQLRSWLTTHNIIAYYALATPTDTEITNSALIAQLEAIRTASLGNGTNTITNTATGTNLAGDMEIGYYGYNPRNRYDKFIWLDLNNNYEQIGGE